MRTYAYTGIFHDLWWSRMDFCMARSSSSSVEYVCFEMICMCMYIHAFYIHILCFAFQLLRGREYFQFCGMFVYSNYMYAYIEYFTSIIFCMARGSSRVMCNGIVTHHAKCDTGLVMWILTQNLYLTKRTVNGDITRKENCDTLCVRCLLITESPKTPGHERWGGWGRDPKKCTGRDWGMGSSTI